MMRGKISAAAARQLISAILVADGAPGNIDVLSDADVNAIAVETHVDFAAVHRAVCEAHARIDKERRVTAEQKLQQRAQRVADVLTRWFGSSVRVGRFSFDPECDDSGENHSDVKVAYTLIFESVLDGIGQQHEITGCLRYVAYYGELGAVSYGRWENGPVTAVHMSDHTARGMGNTSDIYTFLSKLHGAMGISDEVLKMESINHPMLSFI